MKPALASLAQQCSKDMRREETSMPHGFDADRYCDLLPSLENHFASLLARHKEAASKTEWSYQQFVPSEAFRANAIERPPLSATAYLAVETALLTEVNLPWYTAGLSAVSRLPRPDPGVRAHLDLGGGSTRHAAQATSC
jgi:hypothetical protein